MKKFFALLILIVTIALVGCAPTPQTQLSERFDKRKPWVSHSANFQTEISTYKVERFFVKDENDKILVNDPSSRLTYSITRWYNDDGTAFYTLKTDFTITFLNTEYVDDAYKGKTDTITGEAVFRGDNLSAVSTSKQVVLNTAPQNSYSYTVDYENGKASFVSQNGNSELTFDKGTYYDNEYIYYIVRAIKTSNEGTLNETFDIINWYECFLSGKVEKTPMAAATYQTEGVKIPEEILKNFPPESKDSENQTLNCNTVQLRLNRTQAGAPIYLSYASSPYESVIGEVTNTSEKTLAKILTFETTTRGTITYRTEYTLNEYTQNAAD